MPRRRACLVQQYAPQFLEQLFSPLTLRPKERQEPIAHEVVVLVQTIEMLGRRFLHQNHTELRQLSQSALRHRAAGVCLPRDLTPGQRLMCVRQNAQCTHAYA
jgi:hypothetical protein